LTTIYPATQDMAAKQTIDFILGYNLCNLDMLYRISNL